MGRRKPRRGHLCKTVHHRLHVCGNRSQFTCVELNRLSEPHVWLETTGLATSKLLDATTVNDATRMDDDVPTACPTMMLFTATSRGNSTSRQSENA